jgi:RHS repeat-associated protein
MSQHTIHKKVSGLWWLALTLLSAFSGYSQNCSNSSCCANISFSLNTVSITYTNNTAIVSFTPTYTTTLCVDAQSRTLTSVYSATLDFGDGTPTTTFAVPSGSISHTYSLSSICTQSVFNIQTCVANELKTIFCTKSQTIGVGNPASTYTINYVNTGCKTYSINYSGAPVLNNFQWSYGTGAQSAVVTNTANTGTSYTFPSGGNYIVSLIGSGISPCQAYAQITVPDFVVPDFTYTVTSPCTSGVGVNLSISNYTSSNTYSWLFNSTTVPSQGVTGSYAGNLNPGQNTIKLNITNGSGCSTSVTKTITIGSPSSYSITVTPMGCKTYSISYASALPLYNAQWAFGDGSISAIITNTASKGIIHTYPNSGTYVISLSGLGIDPCQTFTQVTVTDFITPAFNYTVTNICTPTAGIVLEIPNYNTSLYSYSWLINSFVVPATGANAAYFTNLQQGINTIKLIITNATGCNSSIIKYVSIGSPSAAFSVFSQSVCVGSPLSVYNLSAGADVYTWDIKKPDNSFEAPIIGMNPNYTFASVGNYQVKLTTQTNGGACTSTAMVTINVSSMPVVNFTIVPFNCNKSVSLTVLTATFTSYTLTYGDGSSFTGGGSILPAHLSYTYATSGSYQVKLVLNNGACSSHYSQNTLINIPNPSLAITSPNLYICPGSVASISATVSALPLSAGTLTYTWSGPNSFTSNLASISATAAGVYSVNVSSSGNCSISLSGIKTTTLLAQPSATVLNVSSISCTATTASATLSILTALRQQGFLVNGTLTAAVPTATAPLTYTLNGLTQGANYVLIANALSPSCNTSILINVSQNLPTLSVAVTQPTNCSPGTGSASITVTPAGGTASWYTLTNFPNTTFTTGTTALNLAAGSYAIKHVNGSCTTTANFTIVQPIINVSKLGGTGACGSGTSPVTLTAQFSPTTISGTFTFTLKKFVASTFTTIGTGVTNTYSIASGNYSISATNKGCTGTYTFPVVSLSPLTVSLKTNTPTCKNPGDVTAIASGGDGNYSYKWFLNGTLSPTTTPLLSLATVTAPTTLSVTVNDQSGCSITQPTPGLVINPVSIVTLTSCVAPGLQGLQNATKITACDISACVTGGTGPYTFEWYREEVQKSFHEWKFKYEGSVFKAVTGTETVIPSVPTSTSNLNLGNNSDFSIGTVSYPTWNFSTTPTATPVLNSAGILALGSASVNSTNTAHYYKVLETTTTTIDVLVTTYSGNSGQTASNKDFKNGIYKLIVTDARGCKYLFNIGTLTFTPTNTVSIAFDFVWGMNENTSTVTPTKDPVLEDLMAEAAADLLNQAGKCMQNKVKDVNNFLKYTCTDLNNIKDRLDLSYVLNEHHHTLYYYNRAGQLTKTVPPEGVAYLSQPDIDLIKSNRSGTVTPVTWPVLSHSMVTTYTYNSFGQLLGQKTPDGGYTSFIYDGKNRLRFSQNEKQKLATQPVYSYTKYDELGRIIEVGESDDNLGTPPEFINLTPPNVINNLAVANTSNFPTSQNKQITRTQYSVITPITYYGKAQRFVQNRVSYTSIDHDPSISGDEDYTYYSYDSHGNVEWIVQDQPGGIGKNYIAYEYDLVSGKVLKVSYNEKRLDRFYHRYVYDAENRLVRTETSRNGELWDQDARYAYYPHGPLKRQVIGEDQVQGLDYIYTIHGWLKSINSPSIAAASDPGLDNYTLTIPPSGKAQDRVAADRFGMVLNYYNGDYTTTAASNFLMTNTRYNMASFSSTTGPSPSLYNGNISSWVQSQLNPTATSPILPRADMFKYDILNRIKQSTAVQESTIAAGWASLSNGDRNFRTFYGYDANGNILYLSRYQNTGALMDSLRYTYDNGLMGPPLNNNLLKSVADATTNSSVGRGDAEGVHSYTYDPIGNLIRETGQERLVTGTSTVAALYSFTNNITWTVYGKIKEITKSIFASPNTLKERITFEYDAAGNRVKKDYWKDNITSPNNIEDATEITTTYYVRDAQGNTMATYQKFFDISDTKFKYQLIEQPIYGSERMGQNTNKITLASAPNPNALVLPGNGFTSLSEYQNWITTTSKTQLLPNGNVNDNLCQCRVISLTSNNNASYQNLQPDLEFLGIANNGVAVAENTGKQLQFYVVLAKNYLGSGDACLVFDNTGKLMKGTELITSIDVNSKPIIVNLPGTKNYVIVTLSATKQPQYHLVDMNLMGYGPVTPAGEVISANLALTTTLTSTHGYHFTGIENHISGNSIVYASRYTPDVNDPNKGTTDILAYNFGTSTLTPVASTIHSIYGCGNTETGELQISPDGNKLAWYQYDKLLAGFTHRSGYIYTLPLTPLKTGLAATPTINPISPAGSHGNGMLEFMQNNNDILYSQRGVYREGTGPTYYDRNVWKYDPINLPTLAAINPNTNPLVSYLFGEIKRGIDGKFYIPNMGRAVDKVHSYSAGAFFSNVVIPDTNYKLTSSLPTQVYKVFPDQSQNIRDYNRLVGQKSYYLQDHLSNVRVTISDAKLITSVGTNSAIIDNGDTFTPDMLSYSDPYPFGFNMPSRQFNSGSKPRYTYNGKEFDPESNTQDYGMRIYDGRIARFLSEDPLTKEYPELTPYQFASNTPIWGVDLDGLEILKFQLIKKDNKSELKSTGVNIGYTNGLGEFVPHPLTYIVEFDGSNYDFASVEEMQDWVTGDQSGIVSREVEAAKMGVEAIASLGPLYIDATNDAVKFAASKGASVPDFNSPTPLPQQQAAANKGVKSDGVKKTDYTGIDPKKGPKVSGNFTDAQRKAMFEKNKQANGGVIKSDISGKVLNPAKKDVKGVKTDMNSAQIDHVRSKKNGGNNAGYNAQIISKEENTKKGPK